MAHKTSAPGSVSGTFVNRNVGTSTPGTYVVAEDANMFQDEICNAVTGAGYTLNSADRAQLVAAIRSLSHTVGEFLFSAINRATSVSFPAVRIDLADVTLASANYPDLVTALYGQALTAQATSSFSCTVSGSTITFPSGTASDKFLSALYDDARVHGGGGESASYTNWRSLTIGSTNYAITGINVGSRTVTVSGTPPSGSQTVQCFPFRIGGSTTSVRIYKTGTRALLSDDGDKILGGLRRRDYMLGHKHEAGHFPGSGSTSTYTIYNGAANVWTRNATDSASPTVGDPVADDSSVTPRISANTEPRGMGAFLYMWAGRYISS